MPLPSRASSCRHLRWPPETPFAWHLTFTQEHPARDSNRSSDVRELCYLPSTLSLLQSLLRHILLHRHRILPVAFTAVLQALDLASVPFSYCFFCLDRSLAPAHVHHPLQSLVSFLSSEWAHPDWLHPHQDPPFCAASALILQVCTVVCALTNT